MGEEAVEVGRDEMVRGPRAQTSSGLYAEAGEDHWGMGMKRIRIVIIIIVIKPNTLPCCSMEEELEGNETSGCNIS